MSAARKLHIAFSLTAIGGYWFPRNVGNHVLDPEIVSVSQHARVQLGIMHRAQKLMPSEVRDGVRCPSVLKL
jgi:hypothetical protein